MHSYAIFHRFFNFSSTVFNLFLWHWTLKLASTKRHQLWQGCRFIVYNYGQFCIIYAIFQFFPLFWKMFIGSGSKCTHFFAIRHPNNQFRVTVACIIMHYVILSVFTIFLHAEGFFMMKLSELNKTGTVACIIMNSNLCNCEWFI